MENKEERRTHKHENFDKENRDTELIKETYVNVKLLHEILKDYEDNMEINRSSIDSIVNENPSVVEESDKTLYSTTSEQVNKVTQRSQRLIRIERLLGIDDNNEDDTHQVDATFSISLEERLAKAEQQIMMIQDKQDRLIEQLEIITTKLEAKVLPVRSTDINSFNVQIEEKSNEEALYDEED